MDFFLSCSSTGECWTPFFRAEGVSKREAEILCNAVGELYGERVPEEDQCMSFRLEPGVNENPARFCALAADYKTFVESDCAWDTLRESHDLATELFPQLLAIRGKIPERHYFLTDFGDGDELIAVIDDLPRGEVEAIAAALTEPIYELGGRFTCRAEGSLRAPLLLHLRLAATDLETNGYDEDDDRSRAMSLYWRYREELDNCRDTIPDWDDVASEWLENLEEDSRHEQGSQSALGEAESPRDATPRLSESEANILAVIRDAGKRMTTTEVLAALDQKHGAAADSTVKTCLAGLVRRELLNNRQDVIPKGYGLPEWEN